jgi:hypothetical protein
MFNEVNSILEQKLPLFIVTGSSGGENLRYQRAAKNIA